MRYTMGYSPQAPRPTGMPKGPFVLSLLIRDKENPEMVLIGVRDPKSNPHHPNVASTVTGRIPSSMAPNLLRTATFDKLVGKEQLSAHVERVYVARSSITVSSKCETDEFYPLFFYVNNLLSKKVLDWKPKFEARIVSMVRGKAMYAPSEIAPEDVNRFKRVNLGDTEAYYETLNMIGVEVMTEGAHAFPAVNTSYSKFAWVAQRQFMEMVRNRSIEPVAAALGTDSVMYCVKGLCLASAYVAIKEKSYN